MFNRVWRGEGWLRLWDEGIIIALLKREEGRRVEEYRGVIITPTRYKVYTSVLAGRLKEEMEGKGLLYGGQEGFRRSILVLDNIYAVFGR